MEMSRYATSAILRGISSIATNGHYIKDERLEGMSAAEKREMHRANHLIDELDRWFEPTMKFRELATSLDNGFDEGIAEEREV